MAKPSIRNAKSSEKKDKFSVLEDDWKDAVAEADTVEIKKRIADISIEMEQVPPVWKRRRSRTSARYPASAVRLSSSKLTWTRRVSPRKREKRRSTASTAARR